MADNLNKFAYILLGLVGIICLVFIAFLVIWAIYELIFNGIGA